MHLFLTLLYLSIFSVLIYKLPVFNRCGIRRIYILAAFYLKVAVGCLLALVYTHYYQNRADNDAFSFFDDAAIIYSSLDEDPVIYLKLLAGAGTDDPEVAKYTNRLQQWIRLYDFGMINDNVTIIRANALIMLISLGHYYVHIVFWCFFSLIGLTAIFRTCNAFFPHKKWAMFLAVFLLPTVLFWSSGVLKEGLLILGLGLFVHSFFKWYQRRCRSLDILYLFLSAVLILYSKSYVLIALLPAVATLVFLRFSGNKNYLVKALGVHVILLLLFVGGSALMPEYNYISQMEWKRKAFINVARQSGSGSLIATEPVGTAYQNLSNAPAAIVRTYFRPWPWEAQNIMYLPAIAENLFLILCLVVMVWNFRMPFRTERDLVLFSLSFVIAMGYISGSVVPVLGALVRYKMPGLIFLFVLIFACTDHLLLQRRFPQLRKLLRKL